MRRRIFGILSVVALVLMMVPAAGCPGGSSEELRLEFRPLSNGSGPETFTGSGTFNVPAGVTQITVEAWGGGGGGGGRASAGGARGGGGGAFASAALDVEPDTTYTVVVGEGGAGGSGNNPGEAGTPSLFYLTDTAILVRAAGGSGGSASGSGAGGLGGTVAASIGDTVFRGGNAERGGGGGAGTTGNGGDTSGTTGGTGTGEGGGNGGNAPTVGNTNGNPGLPSGGGGSGAHAAGPQSRTGGAGADGRVVISWTAAPATYTISGTVTQNGSPLADVLVTGTSNGWSDSDTTDASGEYVLEDVPHGATVTITPSKAGYVFNPTSITPGVVTGDLTGQDFTATAVPAATYTISGTVLLGATGLENVSVAATGGHSQTVNTNAAGVYTFTGVTDGATGIVITPTLAGYTFAPVSRTVDGPVTDNVTGQDFTATAVPAATYTISGTVLLGATGLENVSLAATGGHSQTVNTNAAGVYTFTGVADGATGIVITPTLAGYTFAPVNSTVAGPVTDNVTGQDFTATADPLPTYTISGTITENGGALAGVSVTATGGHSQTANTDAAGVYTFTGVAHGAINILVTPTLAGYTFAPVNSTVDGPVVDNVTDQDFTATADPLPTYTISGTITENGGALAGVLVTGTGNGWTDTDTTDADGKYTLVGVPDGGDVTVTPSKPGYTFNPASLGFAGVTSDLGNVDFTATAAAEPRPPYRWIYSLWLTSTEGGSVTWPTGRRSQPYYREESTLPYREGAIVRLVATPDEGYRFHRWSGDIEHVADPYAARTTVRVMMHARIKAHFVLEDEVLDFGLSVNSTSGGSVTAPGEGTFTYEEGEVVALAAEPQEGYRFVNWTGDVGTIDDVNAASTTIIMRASFSITASFERIAGSGWYTLRTSSTEGGRVTSPGERDFAYAAGRVVRIVAVPEAGYRFVEWTGDVETVADVSARSTTITIVYWTSITAVFERDQ